MVWTPTRTVLDGTKRRRPSFACGATAVELVERATSARVVTCRPVTTLASPMARHAYLVGLDNGRAVKVRFHWDITRAEAIEQNLKTLTSRHFPRVLGRRGSLLILDWMEGETIGAVDDPAVLRECGRLLAWVHSRPVCVEEPPLTHPPRLIPRVRAHIGALLEWGYLSAGDGARLAAEVRQGPPVLSAPGLIHGDFCGENLVLGRDGTVCSIDNEALDTGYAEGDLARALLRWRLSPDGRRSFLAGYAEIGALDTYERSRRFWEIVSLVRSIVFRRRCRGADFGPALQRLVRIAERRPM